MGLIRKSMSVSTAGLIKYRSNSERKAVGTLKQGNAAMREAKAAERLAKAQIKALEAETQAAAAIASQPRSEPSVVPAEDHVHEYRQGLMVHREGKTYRELNCPCGDSQLLAL